MATNIGEKQSLNNLWTIVVGSAFLVLVVILILFPNDALLFLGSFKVFFLDYWWLLFPFPLWYVYTFLWEEYKEYSFLSTFEFVVLELISSRDIEKSPKIMEHVFTGINDYSTPNFLEMYCGWRVLQPKISFEIVGEEGTVHFYIRTPKQLKATISAHIYAHYPDMEIIEVDDYVNKVPRNMPNDNWDVWGSVLSLVKPDPLPIRTYKYFQEEVTGKMIDPLSNMVEVMGALPKGQHIWLQFVLMAEKPPNWHPASKAYVQKLIDEYFDKSNSKKDIPFFSRLWKELVVAPGNILKGLVGAEELDAPPGGSEEETVEFNINKLPPGMQEKVLAIQDNLSKPAYQTVIRFVYLGTKTYFDKNLGVRGLMGSLNQIADINLNDLYTDPRTKTFANYYFDEDRLLYRKRKIVSDYRSRAGQGMWMIMNTEELATLYHFPDMAIRNPAVARVESRREDAPSELPTDVEFRESGH